MYDWTASAAVNPAVPMAMVSRSDMPTGSRMSQSPDARTYSE